jgi:hypothetical protein
MGVLQLFQGSDSWETFKRRVHAKERRIVKVTDLKLKNASLPALGITLGIEDEGEFKGYLRVGRAYMTWTRAGRGANLSPKRGSSFRIG